MCFGPGTGSSLHGSKCSNRHGEQSQLSVRYQMRMSCAGSPASHLPWNMQYYELTVCVLAHFCLLAHEFVRAGSLLSQP